MKKYLKPDFFVDSLNDIPEELLKSKKFLLIDVDNTLSIPEKNTLFENAKLWLELLPKNLTVLLVSNSSRNFSRLKKSIPYEIYSSKKPFLGVWKKIQRKYNCDKKDVLVVGDRLLTDVWFGKRIGCTTVLVRPKAKDHHLLVRLSRHLERLLLR